MCNEAARRIALGTLEAGFSQLGIPLVFPESRPNLAPLDSIRITDASVIVRGAAPAPGAEPAPGASPVAELVQRRWSWPGPPRGKPVYNFRSEGREFRNTATGGRCLIPLDGFYEFTDPGTPADPAAPKPKGKPRKDKWLFTLAPGDNPYGSDFFCVAGLWRADPTVGEAWTMLTMDPGPDVAPYHRRQIVLLPQAAWADWIGGTVPAAGLIAPLPAGTLQVAPVRG